MGDVVNIIQTVFISQNFSWYKTYVQAKPQNAWMSFGWQWVRFASRRNWNIWVGFTRRPSIIWIPGKVPRCEDGWHDNDQMTHQVLVDLYKYDNITHRVLVIQYKCTSYKCDYIHVRAVFEVTSAGVESGHITHRASVSLFKYRRMDHITNTPQRVNWVLLLV